MEPIHLNTPIICVKARERRMIYRFFQRFYTSFAFIVWIMAQFSMNTCQSVPISIILISLGAAFVNATQTNRQYISDIKLIMEDQHPDFNKSNSVGIFLMDFAIHLICVVLSFWWVDDLHTCIPLSKRRQSHVWCLCFLSAFVLHVLQYNITQYKIDQIVKQSYQHVQSDTV